MQPYITLISVSSEDIYQLQNRVGSLSLQMLLRFKCILAASSLTIFLFDDIILVSCTQMHHPSAMPSLHLMILLLVSSTQSMKYHRIHLSSFTDAIASCLDESLFLYLAGVNVVACLLRCDNRLLCVRLIRHSHTVLTLTIF